MDVRERLFESRLCLLATTALCGGRSLLETVRLALAGGVDVVQLREKEIDDGEFAAVARELGPAVRSAGALFLLNDRVRVALEVACDGVHVGQEDLPVPEARRRLGPDAIVGLSTHSAGQAVRAVSLGADYVGVGPVFATATKDTGRAPLGPAGAAAVVADLPIPAFAIGGVGPANAPALAAAGLTRFAVSSAICSAPDPAAAARDLLAVL